MKEMTLRTASQADIPVLYALWQEAFGDEKETIDLFFDTCFQPKNTLVAVCDSKVCSVVYLLENALQSSVERFSACYIYAAATAKAYRGQGMMHALLEFAAETAEMRGVDFLYLVPANAHLFQYYEKCGFHTAFQKQVYTISRAELYVYMKTAKTEVPYIVWDMSVLSFAEKLALAFGENYARCVNGFFLWEQTDECAKVSELCTADGKFSEILSTLLDSCAAKRFVLSLPCGMTFDGVVPRREKSAMLKALSKRAKTQEIQNAYIGMTLG